MGAGRLLALAAGAAALGLGAASPHPFQLTYRDFGVVRATGEFRAGDGYALRFEGCYAKHSAEAVCGFTLRATRPLRVSNLANLSHGSAADGAAIRTCCLFLQGDQRGYPITSSPHDSPNVAVLAHRLEPGETAGFLLRTPDYRTPPLAQITFSRGEDDAGLSFPARVEELP